MDLGTWISVSRPLEPALGRKFHVESEFDVHFLCLSSSVKNVGDTKSITTIKNTIHERCLGPFLTIFGDMKAITPLYFLTGFLALYHAGKRENEGKRCL